jgi:hypothetical protein
VFISILILFALDLYISISNLLVLSNIYVVPRLINATTGEGMNILSVILVALVLLALYPFFLKFVSALVNIFK